MSDTTRVSVPEDTGDEIVIRYGGDDPILYKVEGGTVEVDNEHLDAFLVAVGGSSVETGNGTEAETGNTGTGEEGES
jgi:hypothetical protein